jgi:glutathione peroxidase-family protein
VDEFGERPPVWFRINGVAKTIKGRDSRKKGKDIKWNFTKFLVDRAGNVIGRYGSTTKPAKLERDILRALAI